LGPHLVMPGLSNVCVFRNMGLGMLQLYVVHLYFSFPSHAEICYLKTFFALEPLPFILLLFKYLMIDSFLPVTEDFTCPFCLMKCGNFKVMFFGATFFLCVVFIFHPFLQTVDPKDYVSYFTLKVDNISQR
jgi:hypothetical protein